MADKNRSFFIDMIKGIAIFLMLWGHCIQRCVANSDVDFYENYMFKFIYSFHMPLFMLVSGYLFFYSFSKRELKELLIHKIQSLVQPIVFCSIFNYFVTNVLFGILHADISPAFDGKWLGTLWSLWFLWSVLAAAVVVAIICKQFNNVFVQIALLFVAVPIVAMFPNTDMNLYMYPYFIFGFYFAKYKDKIPSAVHNIKYITLFLFPVLMCFYEKKHYIYTTGIFPNEDYSAVEMIYIDAFRWLIGLVGSVFVITLLQIVYKHLIIKLRKPILSTMFSSMGRKSLQIYTFSMPFLSTYLLRLFPKALSFMNIDNIFVKNMFTYNFVFTLLLSIAYSFVLFYMVKFFDKIKLTKIMFGN